MAIIKCKECGEEISSSVKKCPKCGKDQRNFFLKHKVLIFILAIIVFGIIISIEDNKITTETSNNTFKNKIVTSEDPQEKNKRNDGEGDIEDYHIKIKDYKITSNYSGDPILLVKIAFTNNNDEAKAFSYTIEDKAFQNNVEIKTPISTYGIKKYDWKDKTKEIKKGVTYEFNLAYELSDKKSDVTVELAPLFNTKYSTKIIKIFKIKK